MKSMNHQSIQPHVVVIIVLGVLLCVAGLVWPEHEYERPLTVAVSVWPGAERLLLACDEVNSKTRQINLVEMSWPTVTMGAFRKRVVDAAVVTLDELIRLEAEGAKPRAVMVLGTSKGADAVMGKAGQSMQSLRGKRVGVELRSSGEYLLAQALSAHGMSMKDVEIVPLNLAETENAYGDKDLDAVVTSDPWCLRLQEKGAVVLFDSQHMELDLSRVLVVREDAVKLYPDELHALISACLKKGVLGRLTDLRSGLDASLRREGLTTEQWKKTLLHTRLPEAEENKQLMTAKKGGIQECLQNMAATMKRQGMLDVDIQTFGLLNPVFLEEEK